jgi:hypothetical protein
MTRHKATVADFLAKNYDWVSAPTLSDFFHLLTVYAVEQLFLSHFANYLAKNAVK